MLPRPTTAYPIRLPRGIDRSSRVERCPLRSALPVGAAEALILDGAVFEPAKFFNVFENLVDPVGNAVDTFLITEEEVVREPYRLVIRGPLRNRALVHIAQIERLGASPAQSRIVGGIEREQRTLVNRLVEKTVAWDSFQLEGRDKSRAGNIVRLFGIVLQHVSVRG